MSESKKDTIVTKSMQIGEAVFEVAMKLENDILVFESLRIRNTSNVVIEGYIEEHALQPLIEFLQSVQAKKTTTPIWGDTPWGDTPTPNIGPGVPYTLRGNDYIYGQDGTGTACVPFISIPVEPNTKTKDK